MAEAAGSFQHFVHEIARQFAQSLVRKDIRHGGAICRNREPIERDIPKELSPAFGDEIIYRIGIDTGKTERRLSKRANGRSLRARNSPMEIEPWSKCSITPGADRLRQTKQSAPITRLFTPIRGEELFVAQSVLQR